MHNKIYAIPIEVMQGTGEEVGICVSLLQVCNFFSTFLRVCNVYNFICVTFLFKAVRSHRYLHF